VPRTALRVLDVGCNDGGFGAWLQRDVPGRDVWGVEPDSAQAAIARQSYAGVVTGLYPDALDQLDGDFDCITFNHVLEHMLDPWGALERTRERLAPGGCVVAAIPNIRYVTALVDLAFRGRWDYQDTVPAGPHSSALLHESFDCPAVRGRRSAHRPTAPSQRIRLRQPPSVVADRVTHPWRHHLRGFCRPGGSQVVRRFGLKARLAHQPSQPST